MVKGPYSRVHLRTLAVWVEGALWVNVLVALVATVAAGVARSAASAVRPFGGGADGLRSAGEFYAATMSLWALLTIVIAVGWMIWLYRSHHQVEQLRGTAGRASRGWTVAGWLVPVAHVFVPKLVHDDLYRHAGPSHSFEAAPPLLHWWWTAWLASHAAKVVGESLVPSSNLDVAGWNGYFTGQVVAGVSTIVAGVLAALVVRETALRVDAAAAANGMRPGRLDPAAEAVHQFLERARRMVHEFLESTK